MDRNELVRRVAQAVPDGRLRRSFGRLLKPRIAVRRHLFGAFDFTVDLSMGSLQRQLFLSPEAYETPTQRLLRRLVKPGMCVIDAGANVGFFSVLLASLIGKEGKLFAFEPYEPSYRLLQMNLEANRLDWAQAFQLALSDNDGTAVLSVNPINDGGHSLGDFRVNADLLSWDPAKYVTIVQTSTLDRFLDKQDVHRVDLLKVDVEGAETLLFAGASRLLAGNDAPMIVCEVGEAAQRQFGKSERDLRLQLYAHGYRSYFIEAGLQEFGAETAVQGLPNILFAKLPPSPLHAAG